MSKENRREKPVHHELLRTLETGERGISLEEKEKVKGNEKKKKKF